MAFYPVTAGAVVNGPVLPSTCQPGQVFILLAGGPSDGLFECLTADNWTAVSSGGGGGSGTVTSVSVVTANGVSGTVANATTAPAITLVLGAITPTSVTVNTAAGTLPTLPTGTLYLASATSTPRFTALGVAGAAFFTVARLDGTLASPTAVQSAEQIGGYNSYGYGTSALLGPTTSIRSYADENFATNFGSYLMLSTTATTTATLTDRVKIGSDGGVLVPPTVTGGTKGSGTINAAGLYVAGVAVTVTIANGTASLGTSAIGSGASATVVTVTATGAATTDNVMADFNADPTAVTGYAPTANGMLTIVKYCTANAVNFKVVNNTGASITPGAITLNWRVVR